MAVDLSPDMIRLAVKRSVQFININFQTADILEWPWPRGRFDCMAPASPLCVICRWRRFWSGTRRGACAGWTLSVLDMYKAASAADYLAGVLALPVSMVLRVAHTGRLRDSRAESDAWDQHGKHEHYPILATVRGICTRTLSGSFIRGHLLRRFSIVWKMLAV